MSFLAFDMIYLHYFVGLSSNVYAVRFFDPELVMEEFTGRWRTQMSWKIGVSLGAYLFIIIIELYRWNVIPEKDSLCIRNLRLQELHCQTFWPNANLLRQLHEYARTVYSVHTCRWEDPGGGG